MRLKSLAASLLLGSALAFFTLPVAAQDAGTPANEAAAAAEAVAAPLPDTVIATVGDQTITEADLSFASEDLADELRQMAPDQRRAFLVSVLIDMKMMAKAGKDAGLNQTDIFKRRLDYLEERALRRAYFAEKIAGSVNETSVRAAYDKFVVDFKPEDEVRARHILVATKEEADAVKAELAAGKPFEVEAMAKTIDPSGKTNGGDLGFFGKATMVKEFADAAFALEPGQVSEPVQSQFGWHIIKLEEKRQSAAPSFEQMAGQLSQQVMYDAFDAEMKGLRAGMPVSIADEALAAQVKAQSDPEAVETSPATN